MKVDYEIIKISTPITTLSYSEENGYFVSPNDVEKLIKEHMKKNEYDHIFTVIKFGDDVNKEEVPVNDWIGLRRYGLLWNRIFKHKTSK